MDPNGTGIMTACSQDDGQSWIGYGYTGYDTSFAPQGVAYGEDVIAVFFRSGSADDIYLSRRDNATGRLQYLVKLALHCDQQPRAAWDTKIGLILLGRNSLTHWCMTADAQFGPMTEHYPLPLKNVATDVGVIIFEERYHVFGTSQDGKIQWITSPDANSWESQSFVVQDTNVAEVSSASTVAPVALTGVLFVFYRDGSNLRGLQFVPTSKTWLVIYDKLDFPADFPADSVPVPVDDTEGGILVFFWEANTNAMVNIRVRV
jgi:hypothetical protein